LIFIKKNIEILFRRNPFQIARRINSLASKMNGIDDADAIIVRHPNVAARTCPNLVDQCVAADRISEQSCKVLECVAIIPPQILTGAYPHETAAILRQITRIPAGQPLFGAKQLNVDPCFRRLRKATRNARQQCNQQ